MEKVPLCRDVAASACSFGLVFAQIKELVSRIQGLLDQIVDVPVPQVTGEIPVFVGVWEEIVDAIQLVPQEQVFEECVQNRVLEQTVGSPVPQITEEIVEKVQLVYDSPVPQIMEEIVERVQLVDVGSPVPQITEEIVERLVDVGSPVPQITEEILDSVQLVDVDSPVPQITENFLDSVQLVDVGSPVPQITEEVLDIDVGSAVPQITEEILDSVPIEDVGSVVPLSYALIPHVTDFADEVPNTPLQRIWCIFEEVGSASVEQIVDVPVPQDMETTGGVQVNEELRGWNKESRLAALSRLIADREALLLSGRLNGTVHEKRVRYSIVGCRREIESLDSFSPLDQRCIVETMLADLEQDSDFS